MGRVPEHLDRQELDYQWGSTAESVPIHELSSAGYRVRSARVMGNLQDSSCGIDAVQLRDVSWPVTYHMHTQGSCG